MATIKKKSGAFNLYDCQLSYGELKAFYDSVKGKPGALYDELCRNIEFYLDRLPLPGEEDEKEKGKDDHTRGEVPDEPITELPDPNEVDTGAPSDEDELAGEDALAANELRSREPGAGHSALPPSEEARPAHEKPDEDELPSPDEE